MHKLNQITQNAVSVTIWPGNGLDLHIPGTSAHTRL